MLSHLGRLYGPTEVSARTNILKTDEKGEACVDSTKGVAITEVSRLLSVSLFWTVKLATGLLRVSS